MKSIAHFAATVLLPVALLLGGATAQAADTDGDGIPDVFSGSVSGGTGHTCALDNSGVHCWGASTYGRTNVPTLTNPVSVSAGSEHTCALDDNGVHCWGGGQGYSALPVLSNPVAVSAGGGHSCAIDDAGVQCWLKHGVDNSYGQITVPTLTNPVAVSAGGVHTCALDDNGVHCWGANNYGQTTVPALVNPVAVSAGVYHSCALDDNGVHCWGNNTHGQTAVPALVNPMALSAGGWHTCVLDDNGVHCWGNNNAEGENTVPALSHPVVVSAGTYHSCAIDDTGVHCWGRNLEGQTTVPAGISFKDNCLNVVNPDQKDTDDDDIGDACDPDIDNDGVSNAQDAYPLDPAESVDSDGDGVGDNSDNCLQLQNADQLDNDDDSQGNACDTDDDNDGVLDVNDSFPLDATETEDSDGDNLGDSTDPLPNDANILNNYLGSFKAEKAGVAVAFAGDVNKDGYGDYVVGIPSYDIAPGTVIAKMDVGRAVVISGKNGYELMSIEGVTAKEAMGAAVAGNVDFNGDGYSDVIVGAPHSSDLSNGLKDVGSVTILFGNGTNRFTILGAQAKSQFGAAVAVGDTDGDGYSDLFVGAPKFDAPIDGSKKMLVDAGSVALFHNFCESVSNVPVAMFYGSITKAYAGTAVAAGDVDHDGAADIIIGAPNDNDIDHKLVDAGSVTVYNNVGSLILKKYGAVAKAYLGTSVASGDVNNDTRADVLAGAPGDDNGTLKDVGSVTVLSGTDGSPLTKKYGAVAKAGLGNSVAAGDVNADSNADIVAGAKLDDKPDTKVIKNTGSVSVWSGSDYSLITTLYGDVSKDAFGMSVSAGDVNSDGHADLIIGVPGSDKAAVPPSKKVTADTGKVEVMSGTSFF